MSDTKNQEPSNVKEKSLPGSEDERSDTSPASESSDNRRGSGLKLRRVTGHIHTAVEFLGKHPFATGLFALIGLFGLALSIVGYQLDRIDAKSTKELVTRVESKIDKIKYKTGSGYKVPKIVGLSYDVARKLLLREGWAPNKRHWMHGTTVDVKSGNGPVFWGRGYWELVSCSGTGLAKCMFEFFDPEVRVLVIITEGEEADDGAYHAKVTRVYFSRDRD